jgi:predicted nucleic acid-binding Zn ribbon protein
MLYDYTCSKCGVIWEEQHPMNDRDNPVGKSCPKEYCEKPESCEGLVERSMTAPGLSFEGSVSTIKRAGSEWNDVLKGIKKASGKENTIEHY